MFEGDRRMTPVVRVHLVETNAHGHRLFYVRTLAEGALRLGAKPILWLDEDMTKQSSFAVHVAPLGSRVEVRLLTFRRRDRKSENRYRALILSEVQRHLMDGDVIVLADGDRWITPLLGKPRSFLKHCHVLLLRTSAASRSQLLRMILKLSATRLLAMRGTRVRRLIAPFGASDRGVPGVFDWIPPVADPLPAVHRTPQEVARAKLGLPQKKTIALVAGVIDDRKSVTQLLRWLESSSLTPRPGLVLAGQHSEAVREQVHLFGIRGGAENDCLTSDDGYLENERLDCYYSSADVVMILHENEGPSGALAHAVAHGRPVIAWGSRAVVDAVAGAELGIVVSNRSPESIDAALLALSMATVEARREQATADVSEGEEFLKSILL